MIKTKDKRITKIYAISIIGFIAIALILGATIFNKPAQAVVAQDEAVNLSLSEKALDKILGALGLNVPVLEPVTSLGAVSGPDRFNPCESRDGILECFTTRALTTSTTTICAIQSPVATSTLQSAGLNLTLSSTTASLITVAKATTAFATTTALATTSIAANALGAFTSASTTAATTQTVVSQKLTDVIFGPSEYIVWGMQDTTAEATAGSFSPTGKCHAIFEVF